jgi:NADH:ubiquinone oxidoreductase subunit D
MKSHAEALPTQEMLINMGPQHPSTHGVLRVILRTDGEVVVNARPDVGYLHRALEKIGERVTYAQFMPFTDRLTATRRGPGPWRSWPASRSPSGRNTSA